LRAHKSWNVPIVVCDLKVVGQCELRLSQLKSNCRSGTCLHGLMPPTSTLLQINHAHGCQRLRRVRRGTEPIIITEPVELAVGNVVELPPHYCPSRRQTDETVTAFEDVRPLNRPSVRCELIADDLVEAALMLYA